MWPLFTYFALFQKYIFQIDGGELYILEETFSIFVEMKCGVKVSKTIFLGRGNLIPTEMFAFLYKLFGFIKVLLKYLPILCPLNKKKILKYNIGGGGQADPIEQPILQIPKSCFEEPIC